VGIVSAVHDGKSALQAVASFKARSDNFRHRLARYGWLSGCPGNKKRRNQPFLVALTGYGQEEDKLEAQKAGFNFHLTKPIGLVDIEKSP